MSTQQDIPPTSTSTPEYRAFRQCYEALILTVKLQPGEFCDSLFAKGYIPEAVRDYTRSESNVDKKKAQTLVDSVIDQIKHDSSVFYGFIKILRSRCLDKLAETLEQYCVGCKAEDEQHCESRTEDKQSNTKDASPSDECDRGTSGLCAGEKDGNVLNSYSIYW